MQRKLIHRIASIHMLRTSAKRLATKELPQVFKDALKEVGYHKSDISVEVTTSVSPPFADDGMRPFMVAIDLNNGRYKVQWGSWGMGGGATVSIPSGGAVVAGSTGGRGSFATIYVTPANVSKLIEDEEGEDLTKHEDIVLYLIRSIKSGYREEEMERRGVPGGYSVRNPIIQSLVEKGLAKANSAGAIQTTLNGKNQTLQTRY